MLFLLKWAHWAFLLFSLRCIWRCHFPFSFLQRIIGHRFALCEWRFTFQHIIWPDALHYSQHHFWRNRSPFSVPVPPFLLAYKMFSSSADGLLGQKIEVFERFLVGKTREPTCCEAEPDEIALARRTFNCQWAAKIIRPCKMTESGSWSEIPCNFDDNSSVVPVSRLGNLTAL